MYLHNLGAAPAPARQPMAMPTAASEYFDSYLEGLGIDFSSASDILDTGLKTYAQVQAIRQGPPKAAAQKVIVSASPTPAPAQVAAARPAPAKSKLPLYIGGGLAVLVLGGFLLKMRRRR